MACNCCRVQVVVPEEITITDNVVDISLPATFEPVRRTSHVGSF